MRSPGSLGVSNENHRDFKLQMRLHGVLVGHRLTVEAQERAPLSHGSIKPFDPPTLFHKPTVIFLPTLVFLWKHFAVPHKRTISLPCTRAHFDAGRIGEL